ncbi:hypothetical protein LRH25_20455 [Ideonella azotifigens]|uniref:hypothetical protein n=1 Tax=Ideonella azotifigens TaxID=513160 RepID=UPI001143A300|nr:hypothetical protein [Ideonella azotifigens]MCD2342703.1 hypothetical protein [Ideonella azotifigens]
MTAKLSKDELLRLLDTLMHPKASGLTDEESYNEVLLRFCAGCPDPVKARWLVVECLDTMTDEEMVDRALAMPFRAMTTVPTSELPTGHPLRKLSR